MLSSTLKYDFISSAKQGPGFRPVTLTEGASTLWQERLMKQWEAGSTQEALRL